MSIVRVFGSLESLPWKIAWSPDSQNLAAAFDNGIVRVWNATSGKEASTLRHSDDTPAHSVSWSPDSKRLVSGGDDGTAKVWDPLTGQQLAVFEHANTVDSVAWSPDGKLIAVANEI